MRFTGRCYRAHDPAWSFSPLSGAGAAKTGGRFNPKGQPTLYLALDIITAVNECTQGLTQRLQPLTICEYDADITPIADLRTDTSRTALGIRHQDMACPWLTHLRRGETPPSWTLAETLKASGHAGLLTPSFAPGAPPTAHNLVLWHWSPNLPTRITVHDPQGRLPKNQSSWR